jgi:hypothetical protein
MADPPPSPVAAGGKPATVSTPTLKTIPFPAPSPNPFTAGATVQAKLQRALNDAITAGPGMAWRTPICIVALPKTDGSGPPCTFATFRPSENHYTASLAKVHAMYAAFQLRETLRAIAAELGSKATTANAISIAKAYLNPLIMAQADPILSKAVQDGRSKHAVTLSNKLPSYTGFEAVSAAGGVTVNFTKKYQNSLDQMIFVSSDDEAGKVVHNIGYGYLIGALASAGFYDPSTKNGLWLAADYSMFADWGALTIDTVNDAKASAVATVIQLGSLLTRLYLVGGLFYTGSVKDQPDPADPTGTAGGRAREEMLRLLNGAGSWMSLVKMTLSFKVFGAKVGLGNLKDGTPNVKSEAVLLKHTATNRNFVAAWQNFVEGPLGIDEVAKVIDDTINAFLKP